MERMNFLKTDHSNRLNGQVLLGLLSPAKPFSLVLPTPYAWESSIHLH